MKTQIHIISFGLAGHIEESKNCTKKGEQQSTPEQDMAEMRRLWAAQKQNPLPSARNVEHWHKIQKKAFREACRKALNRP